MRAKIFLLVLLLSAGCHERINPCDPGGENFMTPPPIYFSGPILGWYDNNGYLIGVRMLVEFVEPLPCSFEILNVLYRGTEELARDSIPVGSGMDSYVVDLISDTVLDSGEYIVIYYWGEISIGSSLFQIMTNDGVRRIRDVYDYDVLRRLN
jgi:hypothetical protein